MEGGGGAVAAVSPSPRMPPLSPPFMQVCAEHKKPAKLLKHLASIKDKAQGLRNPPRVLVFANRIKVCVGVYHDDAVLQQYRTCTTIGTVHRSGPP